VSSPMLREEMTGQSDAASAGAGDREDHEDGGRGRERLASDESGEIKKEEWFGGGGEAAASEGRVPGQKSGHYKKERRRRLWGIFFGWPSRAAR
jgi:hypothetical protein